MLTSTNFWLGVGAGLVGCWAWRKYQVRKSS